MAGPWEKYGGAPSASQPGLPRVLEGPPKEPPPQTPEQIESERLSNELKRRQLAKQDAPPTSDNLSVNQANTAGFYARALNANKLYGEGVPPRGAITQTVVDMLPDNLVRANESDARKNAETAAAEFIAATLRKESGAAISPQEFESQYARYFPQPGDGPDQIKLKAQLRAQALEAMRIGAGPQAEQVGDATNPGTREFGGTSDPRVQSMTPEQKAAYDAWFKATPNPTPEALNAFVQSIGIEGPFANAQDIIDHYKKSNQLGHDVTIQPDISDVRNQGDGSDMANAAVRGIGDAATLGTLDKLAAAGQTLTNGGTFQQNLQRQYAISDFDQQNHPIARFAGEAVGGAALPLGEVSSLGNLALKGAGYGAAYGAGSSRSLSDVPMNALLGAGAGAAVPAILGGTGKAVNALRGARTQNGIPPLVDSATGELNQPLDAMTSAQRLDAVRGAGIENPTPGMVGGRSARVLEQGFNNLPGSAGLMEDVNSAASGQLRRGMQSVAQKFGSSKTLNEGGAELQRGASERIERGKGVIEKAYSAIPIPDTAPASKTNTIATLQELTGRFQSNPDLAASLKDPKLAGYLDALQRGDISWRDLKDFRSIIGEKIGEMRFGESSSTSDLRALYAGLSEDMRNTAASLGPKATRAFERANNLNRQNEQLIQGALTRILGKDGNLTPEKAAAAVQAMTRGGKASGDLKTLAQIKNATVKSGAWDEIASTLIHLGGQPAGSEGRAFQPDTFVRWYADMAEPARKMLFKPELRGELDKFVAVNQQLSRLKGLSNSSNTTPTMIGSGVIGASGMIAVTNPMALLVPLGGGIANNLMARLWTSPKFVNLMTGYSKAAATGNQNAVRSQIGRLQKLATTNPELREGIEHLLRSVANDNAPAAGQAAASPDEGPQQQGQPQ